MKKNKFYIISFAFVVIFTLIYYYYNNKNHLLKIDSKVKVVFIVDKSQGLEECKIDPNAITGFIRLQLNSNSLKSNYFNRYPKESFQAIFGALEVNDIGPYLVMSINNKRLNIKDFDANSAIESIHFLLQKIESRLKFDVGGKPLRCPVTFNYIEF